MVGRVVVTLFFWAALLAACGPGVAGEITTEGRPLAPAHDVTPATVTLQATETGAADVPRAAPRSDGGPTPDHTPTPQPTPTAVPPPTPTVSPLPGVREAAPETFPAITHDLLFIASDSLKVWRSAGGQVETLAAPVLDYEVAANGEAILILQPANHAGVAPELVLIHMGSGQKQVLATVEEELVDFSLSLDARRVAYVTGMADPQGSALRPAEPIYVPETAASKGPVRIASCDTTMSIGDQERNYYFPCGPLVWFVDGRAILWGDGAGVWSLAPGASPVLLAPNELDADDPPPRLFRPTEQWSPSGRYQLLSAFRGEGSSRYVHDVNSGALIPVPNSNSGLGDFTYWSWVRDDTLFTVRGPTFSTGEEEAMAELWEIAAEALALAASGPLPGGGAALPAAPAQFADGRFGFVMNAGEGADGLHGLYVLPAVGAEAHRVAELPQVAGVTPPFGQRVYWAPDGSGAVISQAEQTTGEAIYVLYAAAEDGALFSLQPGLGQGLRAFSWLP